MKKNTLFVILGIISATTILYFLFNFFDSKPKNEEQIESRNDNAEIEKSDSLLNSIEGNVSMKQISSFPSKVILTGLPGYRLVSIYKTKKDEEINRASDSYGYDNEGDDETNSHFMPGIDILFGYNLLNIAHYDFKTEKESFLFNHPVLIKTFYYPSFEQDSLNQKLINRDFYLLSVYNEDTNKDKFINKNDLRRFFHINAENSLKTQLIPSDYSAIRSQYDSMNDVMYIFASHDINKNGSQEKTDPMHVFWINLKNPQKAKLLY
jgi:hypothetical protein